MPNVISLRILETLKKNLPYSLLGKSEVERIAERMQVLYLEQGKLLFSKGKPVQPVLYFVAEGLIILEGASDSVQGEWCAEGDTFGIESLDELPLYLHDARVAEEVLLYEIPLSAAIRPLLSSPSIRNFFRGNHPLESLRFSNHGEGADVPVQQSLAPSRALVSCTPETRVVEAARQMAMADVGSMVVLQQEGKPIGILTDKDLRNKVATGIFSLEVPVGQIMSSPVITAPVSSNPTDLHLTMLQHRIRHICITEDGTPGSPARGVWSMSDVLLTESGHAGLLMHKLLKASSAEELIRLSARMDVSLTEAFRRHTGMHVLARQHTELYDALVGRAIELTCIDMQAAGREIPRTPFCWISLGSSARAEQLLKTDQDNALLFGEPAQYGEAAWAPAFFCELGQRVNDVLARCGFEKCPAGLMAGNPAHCLSLETWKLRFSRWIDTPTPESLLDLGVFLDFRPVFGEVALAQELHGTLQTILRGRDNFWAFLAADALHSPPFFNFFRDLVVESTGEHKKEFDVKSRAILPFVDAARVLALHAGYDQTSATLDRLQWLLVADAANAQVYEMAAAAFEYLMEFRTRQGLKNQDAGRYCRLDTLNPLERATLRNVFLPLKSMQQIVRVRFQTAIHGV
ncbi:MAG: DUF294 nucleotidyltransferase-like domain-containing protein [Haliscomenobacter sp.]